MGGLPALSIQPIQQESLLSKLGKMQQLKGQQQNIQEGQLDIQAKQQEQKDQQTIMQVLGMHNGDLESALPELASKVTAKTFLGLQKAAVETKKSAAELDNKMLENHKLRSDAILGVTGEALKMAQQSPELYAQNWPAIAAKVSEIDPNIGKHVDLSKPVPPEMLQQYGLLFQTQSTALAKEAASRAQKQQEMTASSQAETARHNKATEGKQTPGTDVPYSPEVFKQKKALRTSINAGSGTDAKDIADAIENGDQPPTVQGLYRNASPVRAELARRGFNLAQAESDWKATQKHLSTLNGAQQERLRQAITFTSDSTDIIEKLYGEWKQQGLASGVKLFNRATLATSKNLPGKAGAAATALEAQINDLTSELGTVYKGGNSSTDESLKLAASNLNGSWNEETFAKALGLIRTNLKLRKNSITNSQPAGVSADSPYSQPQTKPATNDPFAQFGGKPRQ